MKTKNITNINFLYENGYFFFHSTKLHKELLLNENYQPLKFVEEKTQLIDVTNLPMYLTRIIPSDNSKENYILEFYEITLPDFVNHVLHLEKVEECDSKTTTLITFDVLKSINIKEKGNFNFDSYDVKQIPFFLYNLLKTNTTANLFDEISKYYIKVYNENLKLQAEINDLTNSYEMLEYLYMTIINFCSSNLTKDNSSFKEEFAKWYLKTTTIN